MLPQFDPVELLGRLVSIPSVNPMGAGVTGPEYYESQLTDYLESWFARLGLECQKQQVEPGRENLVARLEGAIPPRQGGRLVLFDAHQDTVPVGGMTIEPWNPVVREGRLFGRGSCDTKGSMAAMMLALARLARERPPGMPTVVMSCAVNEEFGFTGVGKIVELWNEPSRPNQLAGLIPRKPDAALVGEPTDLKVVVAHKGAVRWRCSTLGRAAHSSQPEAGDNAVYKMARVLSSLELYHREVIGTLGTHPLCGKATLNVGTIQGGMSVNTVPERCTIEIDRRTLPGEDTSEARQHVIDYLAALPDLDFPLEHGPPFLQLPPLGDDLNGPLAESFSDCVREVLGWAERAGQTFGTHAAFYSSVGIPALVFGPGSIEQAHTKDEWVSLEQVEQAAEIYYRFVLEGGGTQR